MIKFIIKRDGTTEAFNADKLNNWAEWAEKTLHPKEFNWSSIVLRTISSLSETVTSKELQEILIRECLNQDSWEGNRFAGRLYASSLAKELYPNRKHPKLIDLHKMLADKGIIVFPESYSEEEYTALDKMLNHKRDFTYSHYAINQLMKKYAIQDRVTKQAYETPQFIYMRVVMQTFINYRNEDRLTKMKDLYELLSQHKINVPTPYFANSLTSNPNTSSCSVLTCTDEWESIGVMSTLAYTLTTIGAGVGAHFKTRSINDPVRGGAVRHAGKVPYIRAFANTMKSSTQGSRSGASTIHYPVFDPEIMVLLGLKNPLSVLANRVRESDYAVSINKWFVKRAAQKKPFWLFSYKDNPELFEKFYHADSESWGAELEAFAKANPEKVTEVGAHEIMNEILTQRLETGRLYIHFADTSNKQTPYKDTIYSSNLCIAGDQLVPSNYGLLTAEELYKLGDNLVLLGSDGLVDSSPMKLREKNVDVYEIRLENGMTHKVTDYHKVQTTRGLVECKELVPEQDRVVFKVYPSIHGTLHRPDDANNLGREHKDGTKPDCIPKWVREGDYETKISYIQGLSGDSNIPEKVTAFFEGYPYNFLQQLQVFLGTLGFYYKLYEGADGYPALHPASTVDEFLDHTSKVVSVTYAGKEDVYCPTVDSEDHLFVSNCFLTRNCMEIGLPTTPFRTHAGLYSEIPEGRVAFCNLAGINIPHIKDEEEYEKVAYYALLMVEKGIENSSLPFPALNASLKEDRSAGVGIVGLAYLMAKKGMSYKTQEGRNFIYHQAEKYGYFLTKAAIKLTEELGTCKNMDRSKYADGWLPMDDASPFIKDLVTVPLQYDWESLRTRMKELGGLRFSTLMAIAPSESSSIACSLTNSIYPVRDLSLTKTAGDSANRWVAPESTRLAKKYEIVWDVPNEHIINLYALFQNFMDQGISADLFVDRSENVNVSMADLYKEIIQCAKLGVKTNYYYNTLTDSKEATDFVSKTTEDAEEEVGELEEGCGSGSCTL